VPRPDRGRACLPRKKDGRLRRPIVADLGSLLTRRRTFYLVLLIVSAGLSLRPVQVVERGIGLFFVPTRIVSELTAPARWARTSEVRAAEESLKVDVDQVRREAEQLLADAQASALPAREDLRWYRRMIHGEVIRRQREDLDRVVVRVATLEGIVPGLPVITGNWYVGRVAAIDRDNAGCILVDLVTGSDFRVTARVVPPDSRGYYLEGAAMVVGGLVDVLEGDSGRLYLAVRNPSRRAAGRGLVYVDELPAFAETYAGLAGDFALGELETLRLEGGAKLARIEPGVDFRSGLFQVIVIAPLEGPAEEELELDTFTDRGWIDVRALTRGNVAATREGKRLSAGLLAGVKPGSAVAFGAHLVGRVGECGWGTSDLLGLGDPGLRLAALARIEGDPVPRPLGLLVSRGRSLFDGSLEFRWTCRVDLFEGAPGPIAAELYTGSGEEGVPRGLYIGSTLLPVTVAEHDITVVQDPAVRELDHLWVWRGHSAREEAP